jgi:hypothetical protein
VGEHVREVDRRVVGGQQLEGRGQPHGAGVALHDAVCRERAEHVLQPFRRQPGEVTQRRELAGFGQKT